jgi:hypothetical protein
LPIGTSIYEFVLENVRPVYGKQIITNLADLLTANFGKEWGEKHVRHCLRSPETMDEEQLHQALQSLKTGETINLDPFFKNTYVLNQIKIKVTQYLTELPVK